MLLSVQVLSLHAQRAFDPSQPGPYSTYQPTDVEILDLLRRDPSKDGKHPFQVSETSSCATMHAHAQG